LFPAPVLWSIGLREFLEDKAAFIVVDDDPKCE
jgi:hypothetical protein